VDGAAPALRAGQSLSEGDGIGARTAEDRGEAGEEGGGELAGEETHGSSITDQPHLLGTTRTEDIIVEFLTERQQSGVITTCLALSHHLCKNCGRLSYTFLDIFSLLNILILETADKTYIEFYIIFSYILS